MERIFVSHKLKDVVAREECVRFSQEIDQLITAYHPACSASTST